MIYMELRAPLQRHIKLFRYITPYMGRKILKLILTNFYCSKYHEINIHHSDMYKHVSYEKWFYCVNILYAGSHSGFPMHMSLCEENF